MELEQLKEIAKELNFTYHHMTGAEKLEKMLQDHCTETYGESLTSVANGLKEGKQYKPVSKTYSNKQDSEIEKLSKLTFKEADKVHAKSELEKSSKEALKLVRCIVTCNNKNKTSYTGEIFCVRNAKIQEVKKFVPFGVATHVPTILLNMIKEKKYQMFRKEKRADGNSITRPFLVSEYNIQVLPPITPAEFEAIKRKQLAEGSNNESDRN